MPGRLLYQVGGAGIREHVERASKGAVGTLRCTP